tara:strand:- start:330 stop:962 length:633 start_codon:yes stop_codon:yes gene_type:complete
MNLAKNIDHNLLNNSLNKIASDGSTHHGYSFEDFVTLALGFTEADGTPYRDRKQGGTKNHRQSFDIPQEVAERNPILPEAYKLPWSIKAVKIGTPIGLGTARLQYDAWSTSGLVQVSGFYSKKGGEKRLEHFSIEVVPPDVEYWGNITKELVYRLDPKGVSRECYSRKEFETETGRVNKSRTGVIGLRALGRQRNLQAYMNFSDYNALVA